MRGGAKRCKPPRNPTNPHSRRSLCFVLLLPIPYSPLPVFGETIKAMANLTLVYGMRLLPADEVAEVGDASIALKNGNQAHVTMHILEGSREQIEAQLRMSLDAFFDFYPEI
jgi:hypothetical protein